MKTILCWLLHKYCILTFYLNKKVIINSEFLINELGDVPIILAFWHGRLLFVPFLLPHAQRKKVYTIISLHDDGDFISRAATFFGISAIRGSTNRLSSDEKGAKNRGGSKVTKQSIKLLNDNNIIAYTPDGPKGPNREIHQTSMLKIASMTGAKIIPITVSASRAKFFHSWDRFMLPKFFGTITIIVDKPISIEKNCDKIILENARKNLENSLNIITNKADGLI